MPNLTQECATRKSAEDTNRKLTHNAGIGNLDR